MYVHTYYEFKQRCSYRAINNPVFVAASYKVVIHYIYIPNDSHKLYKLIYKVTNFILIFDALAAVSLSKIAKPLTAFFPEIL